MTTITLDVPDSTLPLINSIGDQLPLVLEMGLSRLTPVSFMAYMEVVGLFIQMPSPETIIKFHFSDEVERRASLLLAKNKSDELSQADEVELERLTELEEKLQVLKAKAAVNIHRQTV